METDLLNQIKQQSVSLSLTEKQDLVDFLAEQLRGNVPAIEVAANGVEADKLRVREREWIEKHRAEFAGQWVALSGDKLLSHGINGREVYAQAKAKGVKVPFVVHLESSDELPFGGW